MIVDDAPRGIGSIGVTPVQFHGETARQNIVPGTAFRELNRC
jgi:hypothetical protein